MSMITGTTRAHETRLCFRGIGFGVYESLAHALPAQTAAKLAYDGKDLEIAVKGPIHNDFASLFDRFIRLVAGALQIPCRGLGETTWIRPTLSRGLEADTCFMFDPLKLDQVKSLLARRINDVASYPNPDLAVEVDISPSAVDRESVYAALLVPEIWVFDGEMLTFKQLDESGDRYVEAQLGLWLPVRPAEVVRWVVEEDSWDSDLWEHRVREWAIAELAALIERGPARS
jgi:Uma2 family endonuclease